MGEIHETACIDDGAAIGEGTRIWHWTHVCAGAVVGAGCSLGQSVYVGPGVVIGDNVKIQNNVSVYEGVEIEDDVFCGPSMVFTNVYNPRSEVVRKSEFRKTRVRRGATLGANCTLVCGVEIGEYAFIGAGTLVRESVAAHALVVGVPGRQIGWMSQYGERLDLPLSGQGKTCCTHTGVEYVLEGSKCMAKTSA